MHEAALYETLADRRVRCNLCAHHCVIPDGRAGVCRVRVNEGGRLYTRVYDRLICQNTDPIEKKPLFHFYPGSAAYSIAAPGCNFRCRWCQNWEISQMPREQRLILGFPVAPQEVVDEALASRCRSVAYTYTEPTIFYEFAYDTARLAHAAGLANVFVTNGYMTGAVLEMLHPYLDAANVDLKAFRENTYHRYVGAGLRPVLDNLKTMKRLGIWLEVTTLVIPDLNDDPAELREAARFVAFELGADTPWHLSRFFPGYQMPDRPPTPLATLRQARDIGLAEGLRYVYLGNVAGGSDTVCHQCGQVLIRRRGYEVSVNHVRAGCCPACHSRVAGVGMDGAAGE